MGTTTISWTTAKEDDDDAEGSRRTSPSVRRADGTNREVKGLVVTWRNCLKHLQDRSCNYSVFNSTSPRKTVNRGTWVKAQDLVLGNIFDKAYSIEFKTGIAVAFSPTPAASRFQNFDIGPHHPEELHRHRKEWPQRTQGRRRRQTRPGRRASRLRPGLHALEHAESSKSDPEKFQCGCPEFWHCWCCKHSLGFGIHKNQTNVPEGFETVKSTLSPREAVVAP